MKKSHSKKKKSKNKPIGLPPGSIVYIGDQADSLSKIRLTRYNPSDIDMVEIEDPEDIKNKLNQDMINWIHVDGIHNVHIVEKLGKIFNLHPLVLEDILNTNQRPKLEQYDQYIFVTTKIVTGDATYSGTIDLEQISFILGENFLLTFKEFETGLLDPIRDRLKLPISRIRNKKADYLLYAILDVIVDHYFVLTESTGDSIQDLEDEIYKEQKETYLQYALSNKRNLLQLRKLLLPVKELMHKIPQLDSELLDKTNTLYYSDLYDHLVTTHESLEMYFELNKSLRESYMSRITLKTNEIMKLLTIISTVFIPLTFIVGVYGMNFKIMPELNLKYGYLYVWLLMIGITIGLIIFFKRKKWL